MNIHKSLLPVFILVSCLGVTPCPAITGVFSGQLALSSSGGKPDRADSHAKPKILYQVAIDAAPTQRLHVKVSLEAPDGPIAFAIPAWTPGYYQILHFESDIENVRATDEQGTTLRIEHASPREWRLGSRSAQPKTVLLTYDVHAHDDGLGFFGSVVLPASKQAYINPASALMYLVGETASPVTLSVTAPAGWKICSPLSPQTDASPSITLQAENYDTLIDSPIQAGQFEVVSFTTDQISFRCVLVGKLKAHREHLAKNLSRIAHAAIQTFGQAPFQSYVFFYHIGGAGFSGGLEHHNSTIIHLPLAASDADEEELLATTAHELFHAWNVKYLRPESLGPFDYTQPVRTASLWFAEGVTDYYADLLLVRAGLRDRAWFYRDIAFRLQDIEDTSARTRVSLKEASLKSWEGESMGYGGLSYYLKGSLVGFYFDLRLRELTQGRKGMDNVLRDLSSKYGSHNVGYPEGALLTALNQVAGTDLSREYERYIDGTDEIDWNTVLLPVGLKLQREETAFLGITFRDAGDPTPNSSISGEAPIVAGLETGQAAEKLGLRTGDRVVAINHMAVTSGTMSEVIHNLTPHSPITVEIARDGQTLILEGMIGGHYTHHSLGPDADSKPTDSQQRILQDLFGSETGM